MAETDVLNQIQGYDPALGFSPNCDIGYERITPKSIFSKKASGGRPYDLEGINDGYSFQMSFTGRPWTCIQRVRRFYEEFKHGYFTFIDWEGGGREYVGRITTMPSETRTRNGVFSLAGVVFTEIPNCPMRAYPTDWEGDGVWLSPIDGWGKLQVAVDGAWTKVQRQFGDTSVTTVDSAGVAADAAQYEYLGYGFQLWMMNGPGFGIIDIYLDGTKLETLDLYAANNSLALVHEEKKVSRDFHRVKVVISGNKNAAATAAAASWHRLRVIR